VLYELLPIEISVGECRFDKLAYRVAFTGSQNEVVSLSKLRNRQVALCVQVAQEQLLLQTRLDRSNRPRDFACDERFAASRAFMVKQGAVASARP